MDYDLYEDSSQSLLKKDILETDGTKTSDNSLSSHSFVEIDIRNKTSGITSEGDANEAFEKLDIFINQVNSRLAASSVCLKD
jgi:hypothetical protein